MIDVHCHLEQPDYDKDREAVISRCRQLTAVISSCGHPKHFNLTMQLVGKYPNFIFATASIHPIYVKEISKEQITEFFELIKKNRESLVGIGETGLDFKIEEEFRKRQEELFLEFIELSKALRLPLVVHARAAFAEAIEILEQHAAKHVLIHFFTARKLLSKVIDNGWYISVNTTLLRSKNIIKIVRDMPIEKILTETDSPWLAVGNGIKEPSEKRNEPTAIKLVVKKIAEIKKLPVAEVDRQTTENAKKFFKLKIKNRV